MKTKERITRYEQWKASTHSRKGGISFVIGFGSRAPREVCQPLERRRSSSHSTIFRRSPHGSDYSDSYRPQRRAFSACSVRRHCCIDINKLTGQGTLSSLTNRQHVNLCHSDRTWLCVDCAAVMKDYKKLGYFSPQLCRRRLHSSGDSLSREGTLTSFCSPDLKQLSLTPKHPFFRADVSCTPVQLKGCSQKMHRLRRKLNFTESLSGSMSTIAEEKIL